jgi:hypothetical protein
MKPLLFLICASIVTACLPSCTTDTEELRWKLREKNERYLDRQQRWKMRREARQERTDAWFDRVMGI